MIPKMKIFDRMKTRLITALILSIASCTISNEMEVNQDDDKARKYHTFRIEADGGDYGSLSSITKSSMTIDDDTIIDLSVFAFDPETGDIMYYNEEAGDELNGTPVCRYVEGSTSFDWCLPLDVEMDFYAVANLGRLDTPSNLTEFLSYPEMKFTCTRISELNESGVPMTGILKGQVNTEDSYSFSIPMKRILSRFNIEIDNTKITSDIIESEITKIDLLNVHTKTTLFSDEDEYAMGPEDVVDCFDYADEDDLSALNSGSSNTISLYMLENMQTTGNMIDGGASGYWYEIKDYMTAMGGDYCTCLVIYFNQKFSDGTEEGRESYIYLGEDCVNNFDIKRNTVKTLRVIVPNFKEDEIRIEMPYLVFRHGPYYIYPGSEVSVPFGYGGLSRNITTDTFSSSSSLLTVTEVEPDDGVGYVTVYCSPDADPGSILYLEGRMDEANAKTFITVKSGKKDNLLTFDIGNATSTTFEYTSTYATDVVIYVNVKYWNGSDVCEGIFAVPSGYSSGEIYFQYAGRILEITGHSLDTYTNYNYLFQLEGAPELCSIALSTTFENGELFIYQTGTGSGSISVMVRGYDKDRPSDEFEDVEITIPVSSSGGSRYIDISDQMDCTDGVITEIMSYTPVESGDTIYQIRLSSD